MFKCKHCLNEIFYIKKKSVHVGMYCKKCHAWKQWLSKSEIRKYKLQGIELIEDEKNKQIEIGEL